MAHKVIACWLLLAALAAPEQPSFKPRDLFYSKASRPSSEGTRERADETSCASCNLAVRYRIQRRQPDGGFLGVDPAVTVFAKGDQIRVAIQSNRRAHAYVIQRGSSGAWSVVMPPQPVPNGGLAYVPPDPGAIGFDGSPGAENLYLLFSTREDLDVTGLIAALNQRRTADPVVQRLLHHGDGLRFRDLVIEKSSDRTAGGVAETAFYAGNEAGARAVPVIVRVQLDHR